jgi:hypothetical protein
VWAASAALPTLFATIHLQDLNSNEVGHKTLQKVHWCLHNAEYIIVALDTKLFTIGLGVLLI